MRAPVRNADENDAVTEEPLRGATFERRDFIKSPGAKSTLQWGYSARPYGATAYSRCHLRHKGCLRAVKMGVF